MDIAGLTLHHPTGQQKFHSADDMPKSGTCGMMSLLLVFHIFPEVLKPAEKHGQDMSRLPRPKSTP